MSFTNFETIGTPEKGIDFYNRTAATGYDPEPPFALTPNRAHVYVHENTLTEYYSLQLILDAATTNTSGTARVSFNGLPLPAQVWLLDDPGEGGTHVTTPPTAVHDFTWAMNRADGIVWRDLFGQWTISIDFSNVVGLDSIALYDGPSDTSPTAIDVGPLTNTLYIRAVSEPAMVGLMGAMMIGGAIVANRRRKG